VKARRFQATTLYFRNYLTDKIFISMNDRDAFRYVNLEEVLTSDIYSAATKKGRGGDSDP
jgi:hypothetical protein